MVLSCSLSSSDQVLVWRSHSLANANWTIVLARPSGEVPRAYDGRGVTELPFAWRDYLSLALQLEVAGDEPSERAAIGRAYYAVYGTAEERRKADGIATGRVKGGWHAKL